MTDSAPKAVACNAASVVNGINAVMRERFAPVHQFASAVYREYIRRFTPPPAGRPGFGFNLPTIK